MHYVYRTCATLCVYGGGVRCIVRLYGGWRGKGRSKQGKYIPACNFSVHMILQMFSVYTWWCTLKGSGDMHSKWCGRGSCFGSETGSYIRTLSSSCNKGGFNAGKFFAPKIFINYKTVCSWWRPFGLKCPTIRSTLLRQLLSVTPRDIADVRM